MDKKILVMTPAFSGGSWISIEKILDELYSKNKDIKIINVGLGERNFIKIEIIVIFQFHILVTINGDISRIFIL